MNGFLGPLDSLVDHPRRLVAAVLVVASVVAGFAVAYFLSDVLFSLFVGVVLATALKPVIVAAQRLGMRQPLAVAVVYACIAAILVAVIVMGVPPAIRWAREFAHEIPHANGQVRQWVAGAGNRLWAKFARRVMEGISFDSVSEKMERSLATIGQTASFLGLLARGLLGAGAVVLLAFYWSLQGDRTVRWLMLLLPEARRDATWDALDEIETKLGAYIRGQCMVCLAMAGMAAAAYNLMGLRYASLLGLTAGLLEVMPVLGPILGAVPPLAVALFTASGKFMWVLAAAVLMQQVESYLIVPRIMDKSVGVHPMVTLLAIAGFGALLGIPGAILAIPLAAIVQVLLNRFFLIPATTERKQPDGRGTASVLRYDVQELMADIRLREKAAPPASDAVRLSEGIEAIARDLELLLSKCEAADGVENEP